ncbi:hypothetical protein BDZ45DRAFT_744984 [Acephala macrosclerotiorum]|nr:hypothetical protein BDZ45DRAFT_744984 [Acephala macrosclerotiorum]
MAANEYYSGQSQTQGQHPYQNATHLAPHSTGISAASPPTWTPEPPKSPWERPQHIHQAPEPAYQQQPGDQPKYYPNQQPQQGYGGQAGYGGQGMQGDGKQTHVVVVQQRSSSKEDAALGFCAGFRMGWDMVLGLRSLMDGIFRTMVWCIVNVLWMEGIWET